MKKVNIKLILTFLAVFILGTAAMFFFVEMDKSSQDQEIEKPLEEDIDSEAVNQIEKLLTTIPEDDERMKVIGKNEDEIREEFEKEKEACLNIYDNEENLLESSNNVQASRYYTCKAVKEKDVDICNSLQEVNPASNSRCRRTYQTYNNVIFPSLEADFCTQEAINACRESGDPEVRSEDCTNLCRGLVEKRVEGCNNIENPLHKSMCMAVAERDISYCDQVSGEDRINCRDQYYFFEAEETGNNDYLEDIEIEFNYILAKLFLNKNESCSQILSSRNEEFCDSEYSESRLENRLEMGREFTEIESDFDVDLEKYIQQQ